MSWRQFVDWQRYAAAEPFGERRTDERLAFVAFQFAKLMFGKGRKRFDVTYFLPEKSRPKPQREVIRTPQQWKSFSAGMIGMMSRGG